MQSRNVLCIDDKDTCNLYETLFFDENKRLWFISPESMEEAVAMVKSRKIDLYVFEPSKRDFDSFELCQVIKQTGSKTPIVFYSGFSDRKYRQLAFAAGADAYFVKAADFDQFVETVKDLLQ